MPADLMKQEDKNGDGFIDWEEFGGPKGDKAPEVTQWLMLKILSKLFYSIPNE